MNLFLILVLLGLPVGDRVPGGGAFEGGTLTSDLDMNGNDILNVDDIYHDAAMATDATTTPVTIIGTKHPIQTIGATNIDGADLVLVPASGANNLTNVNRGGTTGDTITFVTVSMEGVSTTTIITEGDGTGGTYECDAAATDVICVCNLYDVVVALSPSLGIGVARADGTCTGETLLFYPVMGTTAYLSVTPSDGVNTVISRGTDGRVVIPGGKLQFVGQLLVPFGTTGLPGWAFEGDPDTGMGRAGANIIAVSTGGGRRWLFGSAGLLTSESAGAHISMKTRNISSDTGALRLCGVFSTTHGLGAGDGGCSGDFEVAGASWFNGLASFASNLTLTHDGTDAVIMALTGNMHVVANATLLADKQKDLVESSATVFAQVAMDSNSHHTLDLFYSVHADDGTDFQARSGVIAVAAVNKAGTITCDIGTPPGNFEAIAVSAGTLTVTMDCADGGSGLLDLRANAVSSLTQTTLQVHFSIVLNDPAVVTLP